ncbi:MAG: YMGG-like glycine zipper-containing protein [Chitinophagaceae bacterium]
MKKIFLSIAIASVFVACDRNSNADLKTDPQVVGVTDRAMYSNEVLAEHAGMIAADAMGKVEDNQPAVRNNNNSNNSTPRRSTARRSQNRTYSGNSNTSNSTAQAPVATRKSGWSKAAKGAVIGGVGGAVTGAIISKNKVKGAVIGGVIGAGGGYVIGRSKDKKDGRY